MHRSVCAVLLALTAACASTTASVSESEAAPAPAPSAAAPASAPAESRALVVRDMDGKEHDLEGRAAALVFWQTWCAECKREAPVVAEAVRSLGDRVRFLGVVTGNDEDIDDVEVRETAAAWKLPYPQVRDRDLALAERFEVQGTPTIVVLDAKGTVRYQGHRPPEDWAALIR